MHRRDLLRTGASVAATLGAVPLVADRVRADGSGAAFEPLARLPVEGTKEAVVGDGRTAYLATTDGFAAVDVSDPREPSVRSERRDLLADREAGPMRDVYDVAVDGDRLLAVAPAHATDDEAFHGAAVYDVADPAAPSLVGVHPTDFPIHNAFLRDGVAYLVGNGADGNPLVTVDVRDDPAELGRWSLFDVDDRWRDVDERLRVLHDVYVQGDRAYLAHWDAGAWILDVSDPATPEALGRVDAVPPDELAAVEASDVPAVAQQLPGNAHYAAVDERGDLLAVGKESWEVPDDDYDSGPGGIDLYDVTDPAAPEQVGHVEPPQTSDPTRDGVWTTAHNFGFADGRLYSAWYQGGVRVHDVADPAAPLELAAWRDADAAHFWTAVPAADCVVASSWDGETVGLFTFPLPADGADGTTEAATSTVANSTPAPTSTTDTPTTDDAGDADGATAPDAGQVGPGVAGVAGALALAAWRRLDRPP